MKKYKMCIRYFLNHITNYKIAVIFTEKRNYFSFKKYFISKLFSYLILRMDSSPFIIYTKIKYSFTGCNY